MNPAVAATHSDTRFFGHPRGLATLFFTEMWERFSYYGMRAILILFMTASVANGGLGFPVVKAGAIYGFYTAMVYLLSLPGGWVADRIFGQRRAVLYGGILIAAGEFALMSPAIGGFYSGLALLIVGTGLLKPNVSTMVGQLYAQGDRRRDSGFSIFYMGINLGAFSPLAVGWVGERINWRLGFGLAGIGMLAGLIQFLLGAKYLGTAGQPPQARIRLQRSGVLAMTASALILAAVGLLAATGRIEITVERISSALGLVLILVSLAIFAWLLLGPGWSVTERKRSGAILVLFIASAVFWAAYEQGGSSLNLFAERSTRHVLLGFDFPPSWFQFVPAAFVMILAPVFAWLWIALGKREPSSPTKFAWSLVFSGIAFAILIPPARVAIAGGLVSPWWLTGTYFVQTVAEMCLSPVGLSAMTKLAPARLAGMMMGLWFVSISIGDYLAGTAASLYESMPLPTLFGTVAIISFGAAVVLVLLVKPTKKLMGGVN
ncbi:MAG TPA: peptide MFS transporter [Bryobacteraceae bacterium]|jgi:proton-dependent oligopeptide transporter, POT family|nr:peptide MFS transporter [Bryobacteraceae bacterium]